MFEGRIVPGARQRLKPVIHPKPSNRGDANVGYMGSCQNYGHFSGTLNIRCRIILGTQKGTIILTATHMLHHSWATVYIFMGS